MTNPSGSRAVPVRATGVGALLLVGAALVYCQPTSGRGPDHPESGTVELSAAPGRSSSNPDSTRPPSMARTDPLPLDTVAGSVVFADGLPCRRGRVEVVVASGYRSHSPTDDFGRFGLRVPRVDTTVDIEVTAPGAIPLHQTVDLSALPRDVRGDRVVHLRALRRVTVHVTVEIDSSIEPWIESTHRIRLAIRRVSLFSPSGFEAVRSSSVRTVPIRGTEWPITFTADEDRLRDHRGWVVSCDLATRWPVHWCEVPIVLAGGSDGQSTASVLIRLDASHVLRGTVTSEDGIPLQSGRVVFERSGAEAGFCYSGSDGRFLLPVPGESDGRVIIRFGSTRTDLGLRTPGDDMGAVVVAIPDCIRVRLVDVERRPITEFVVGYSNLHRRPRDLVSRVREHRGGVVVLRSSALSRGDRLFFEGDFGQMVFEVSEELRGGSSPIEIVAVPQPTGSLRVKGPGLVAGSTRIELREARIARRYSDSRSYVASVPGSGEPCTLDDVVTGDYRYTVRVGRSAAAQGLVRIYEGDNELVLR